MVAISNSVVAIASIAMQEISYHTALSQRAEIYSGIQSLLARLSATSQASLTVRIMWPVAVQKLRR